MVAVSDRYFPARDSRTSIEVTSKSGAWLSSTALIAASKPDWFKPTILIGKSVGYWIGLSCSAMICDPALRNGPCYRMSKRVDGGVVAAAQLSVHRTGPAVADGPAVEFDDRQHLAGGRAEHQFVGRTHLVHRDHPRLECDRGLCAQFLDESVADALQDQMVARRRQHAPAFDQPDVAGRALGQASVAM